MVLLSPVIFGAIWAATLYGDTHAQTMLGGANWLRIAAMVLLVVGLAIRWTAIFTLGRSFSTNVAIHATQTIHKTGLFRWMRHPSYTGMLLCFFAVGTFERNTAILAFLLLFPQPALIYPIHY